MKTNQMNSTTRAGALLVAALIGALAFTTIAQAQTTPKTTTADSKKPNIVLVLMDNFGWGELGVYGGGLLRGAATPRLRPKEQGNTKWAQQHGTRCTQCQAAHVHA